MSDRKCGLVWGEKKKSTTWKRRSHVVDMLAKCGHRGGAGVKRVSQCGSSPEEEEEEEEGSSTDT